MKKPFAFAALMSVVTSRQLTPTLDEHHSLLRHLTGCGTVGGTPDGQKLYARAQEALFEQFPALGDGDTMFATGELILMLETDAGKQQPKELILGWLSQQALRLGMDLNEPVMVEELATR